MRTFWIWRPFVFGMLICFLGVACNPLTIRERSREQVRSLEIVRQVSNQLQVGMSRSEVESIVNPLAWKHYRCPALKSSTDIYLFGSHDPELTAILHLTFLSPEGIESLNRIAGMDNYLLENSTLGCEATLLHESKQ
jgi:hypothetical protein